MYHLYGIDAVTLVLVEWRDVLDAAVSETVNVNANVIALMAFDAAEVDSKLKHSKGYLSSTNSSPDLVSNFVYATNRYSVKI